MLVPGDLAQMHLFFRFWLLILFFAPAMFSQTAPLKIEGVSEPPELTGEPKEFVKPTDTDSEFYEIVVHVKDTDDSETRASMAKLDEFIKRHPDFWDAYFLRATCQSCILNSNDFNAIASDVRATMSHQSKIYSATDYYSLLGKLALATGQYGEAMDDLEKAMRRDLSTADKMFNTGAVEPEKTSKLCTWNLTDLDLLVNRFPKDYRARLYRGLYYKFFTMFKEKYYTAAKQDFQLAALLNPGSPLAPYLLARLHGQASFWTVKAASSEAIRKEEIRNSIQAYTKAIQSDSKFLPAYEGRAGAYLNLKQYPQAIKDFDKVLALDPENSSAYSDRGIAKMESGDYISAKLDFGEAIQRKDKADTFLSNLFEYRGDTNIRFGSYRDAIADYSKAIERRLSNDIFLFSVNQIRALYPEYDRITDDMLCHKLHLLFFPQMKYEDFAQQLKEKNGNWAISMLNDLYEKRGDAYLQVGDYRRGALDFNRIFKGIPNFANSTDRWRMLSKADDKDYYLDVKSAEFSSDGPARFWIKTINTNQKKETRTEYEVDCKARRLSSTSMVEYDPRGKVVNSSDVGSGWQRIVPDTIGEQLYNGVCSQTR
jgi:tetratricopeptide (TPR) repeat protein